MAGTCPAIGADTYAVSCTLYWPLPTAVPPLPLLRGILSSLQAARAIAKMNDTDLGGRLIHVREDREDPSGRQLLQAPPLSYPAQNAYPYGPVAPGPYGNWPPAAGPGYGAFGGRFPLGAGGYPGGGHMGPPEFFGWCV